MKIFQRALGLALVATIGATVVNAQQLFFNYATNGFIPHNVIVAGHEANGQELYACVTPHNGGVHPGKIRHGFNGCNIGYGGRELTGWEYEVISGSGYWTWADWPGHIPQRAFQVGQEANGQPLYVCRAAWANGLHPGKIRQGFAGCNIPFGGREITVSSYEVLEF